MRHPAPLLASVISMLPLLAGCFTLPPKTMVSHPNASFVYDVPDSAGTHKVDITMAIVRPTIRAVSSEQGSVAAYRNLGSFPTDFEVMQQTEEMKRAFVAAVKKDLDRIMVEKGMRTMGPYDTFDELTFSEKKEATYALVPQVELRVAWPPAESHGEYYTVNGDLTVDGEFMLVLSEPLSGQKIWTKRLAIPPRTGKFTVSSRLNTNGIAMWDETHDDRAEIAAQLLAPFYKDLMDTVWRQADVNEFVSLKGQSGELKQRAAPTMK